MLANTFTFAFGYVGKHSMALLYILFFGLLTLFLCSLGFVDTARLAPQVQGMLLLVIMFFMGQRLLEEFHLRCRQDHILPGILLSGCSPAILFFGITTALFVWMMLLELTVVVTMSVLLPTIEWQSWLTLWQTLCVGTYAYISLGTLCYGFMAFGGVAAPMVLTLYFPLLIPLFLLMHRSLMSALQPATPSISGPLLGIALIFVFLAALLYEWVTESTV